MTETPKTDAALQAVVDNGGTLGEEHKPLIEFARTAEKKLVKHHAALLSMLSGLAGLCATEKISINDIIEEKDFIEATKIIAEEYS